jgi:L-ascorbate metabolism protein UlaG (beta-lactamase superfamily)
MRVRWYGQSAFLLEDGGASVFVDPFGDAGDALAARGLEFRYPAITGVSADLLLITHEHMDHNAAEVVGGDPRVIRSTAGTFDDVVAVASEHDEVAGTERGPNSIVCFTLGGRRICHLGDFGQPALRPEQRSAIGDVDVLFVPVGGGPTIGVENAVRLVDELAPSIVVPMHYRTEALNFLEPPDAFLDALGAEVTRLDTSDTELGTHAGVVLFAPPL